MNETFDGQYLPEQLEKAQKHFESIGDYYTVNMIKAAIQRIKWLEAQLAFSDRAF